MTFCQRNNSLLRAPARDVQAINPLFSLLAFVQWQCACPRLIHCSPLEVDLGVQNMEAGMRDDQFARTPLTLHYPAVPHVSTPLLNF